MMSNLEKNNRIKEYIINRYKNIRNDFFNKHEFCYKDDLFIYLDFVEKNFDFYVTMIHFYERYLDKKWVHDIKENINNIKNNITIDDYEYILNCEWSILDNRF